MGSFAKPAGGLVVSIVLIALVWLGVSQHDDAVDAASLVSTQAAAKAATLFSGRPGVVFTARQDEMDADRFVCQASDGREEISIDKVTGQVLDAFYPHDEVAQSYDAAFTETDAIAVAEAYIREHGVRIPSGERTVTGFNVPGDDLSHFTVAWRQPSVDDATTYGRVEVTVDAYTGTVWSFSYRPDGASARFPATVAISRERAGEIAASRRPGDVRLIDVSINMCWREVSGVDRAAWSVYARYNEPSTGPNGEPILLASTSRVYVDAETGEILR